VTDQPTNEGRVRRLIVLGSTGSIGRSAMDVVAHLHENGLARFEIVGLAAGRNAALLTEQANRFGVSTVALCEGNHSSLDGFSGQVFWGDRAATELIEHVAQPGDLVLGAMVGSSGLPPTIAAIERGCDVALANKETLVAAGDLVMPLVREKGVDLLPVDSEHNALAQCLRAGRSIDEVRRLVLTASGGPFRTWSADRTKRATVHEALDHPTWDMGPKITVDSASMTNKALEVIEAHWLFGLPAERIDVVVHPQSIVHSMVEFVDGSTIAQLSPPDMRMPIQYALTWPDRVAGCTRTMDWSTMQRFEFEPVDRDRFPAVGLAYDVIRRGGTSGAIFNAANEAAVEAFLAGDVQFGGIGELVSEAMARVPSRRFSTLDEVLQADDAARRCVAELLDEPRGVQRAEPAGSGTVRPG